jgi:hypothetical protein
MADNTTSLVDGYGAHSDWLEIYNPDATTLNLNGWPLTDASGLLTKWTFPGVSVNPGGTFWPDTANLASNSFTTDFTRAISAGTSPFWNLDFGSDAVICGHSGAH